MKLEKMHFMVVKIESYVREKNSSLIPPPPSSKQSLEVSKIKKIRKTSKNLS
jgi:hypothetical protein